MSVKKSLFSDLMIVNDLEKVETSEDQDFEMNEEESEELDSSENVEEVSDDDTVDSQNDDDDSSDDDSQEVTQFQAFHDILVEKGLIAPIENFDGSETMLEEHFETLPEQYFLQAVSEIDQSVQPLLQYVFSKGENATIEDAWKFFEKHVVPAQELETLDIENEEVAYDYLLNKWKGTTQFRSEDKLKKYLDDLVVDKSLVDAAKEQYDREQKDHAQAMEAAIKKANDEKLAKQAADKAFGKLILDELEQLPWAAATKSQVLQNLKPEVLEGIHSNVFKSPKAVLQMAAFLSHFDPKTQDFNLESYGKQVASKNVEKEKDKISRMGGLTSHLMKVKQGAKPQTAGRRLTDDLTKI